MSKTELFNVVGKLLCVKFDLNSLTVEKAARQEEAAFFVSIVLLPPFVEDLGVILSKVITRFLAAANHEAHILNFSLL